MKTIKIIALSCLLHYNLSGQPPQVNKTPLKIFKIGGVTEVIDAPMLGVSMGIERTFGKQWSLNMDMSFAKGWKSEVYIFDSGHAPNPNEVFSVVYPYQAQATILESSLRFYPKHTGRGFFLGLGAYLIGYKEHVLNTQLGYGNTSIETVTTPLAKAKFLLGYNIKLEKPWFFDLNVGFGGGHKEAGLLSLSFRVGCLLNDIKSHAQFYKRKR